MHTKALRRKHFPPRHPIRRMRLLAWNVHMGLSPQAAAKRLGMTEAELQEALHHTDFEVALADIAAFVAQGVEAMNAELVVAAACVLEQLLFECEPRTCLYLVHCAAEGKNGFKLIVQATDRAMARMREEKAAREAAEKPPDRKPRKPEPRNAARMRQINLDLRDRLLAVYASIVEARALEAANRPSRKAKARGDLLYGAADELIQAAMDLRRPQTVPPDSS